tara:strand:- start:249 stop:428 length:180 start_codon:yes stop_codon:yes gene_type:complete
MEIKKTHWTASGKMIDDCEGCGSHGIIASNLSGKKLCRACDAKGKATDAGIDAMKGDGT